MEILELSYGKELILDLCDCDPSNFTRKNITNFFKVLCKSIDMEICDRHFWDDEDTPEEEKETLPHLRGTSAIQFIKTSNVTIHTLDLLREVYLNIFSCKDFSPEIVADISVKFFGGRVNNYTFLERG